MNPLVSESTFDQNLESEREEKININHWLIRYFNNWFVNNLNSMI